MNCPACLILRSRLYAASVQMQVDTRPSDEQLMVIEANRQTPEYQKALSDLREHLKEHREMK